MPEFDDAELYEDPYNDTWHEVTEEAFDWHQQLMFGPSIEDLNRLPLFEAQEDYAETRSHYPEVTG